MEEALIEARKAYKKGEVPVGAVVVRNNKIIGRGHNLVEHKKSPIYHAEITAISQACKRIKDWRLNDCEIYVTLEPCEMCMGTIKQSRISKVYYGANKNKEEIGESEAYEQLIEKMDYTDDCSNLIKDFFKNKRNKKKNK